MQGRGVWERRWVLAEPREVRGVADAPQGRNSGKGQCGVRGVSAGAGKEGVKSP